MAGAQSVTGIGLVVFKTSKKIVIEKKFLTTRQERFLNNKHIFGLSHVIHESRKVFLVNKMTLGNPKP